MKCFLLFVAECFAGQKNMKKNESMTDRWIRAIIGVVILYVSYAMLSGALAIVGYFVGAVLIVTALSGCCYLYKVLGFSTKKD
jgi:hypothetical protein